MSAGHITMKRRDAVKILVSGGVGVLPTDTIYGLVGSAYSRQAVARIYRLRKRNPQKPMIILAASTDDLRKFGIELDLATRRLLMNVWPGKVSVVLPIGSHRKTIIRKLDYLHRGTAVLAFRVPGSARLRRMLEDTGPIVAPSANFEGESPARTIRAAKKYFGEDVDFYIDGGRLTSKPSTLIKIEQGSAVVLREGSTKLSPEILSAHSVE
jgi:L-threonylcarbamoyladenylate synthase